MKLRKETIKELAVIMKEEFKLDLSLSEAEKIAYVLVAYFDLLLRGEQRRFGNNQPGLIDSYEKK